MSKPSSPSSDKESTHHEGNNHNGRYGNSGSGSSNSSDDGEIRTLFVSGLPYDIRDREIYNLFRHYAGFEHYNLRMMDGKMPVVFASFETQQAALSARDQLQGLQFDLDSPFLLKVELAKQNSKAGKRKRSDSVGPVVDKRPKAGFDGYGFPPMSHGAYPPMGFHEVNHVWPPSHAVYPPILPPVDPYHKKPGPFPPCSTLFVGNLSQHATEPEMIEIFKYFNGFQKLKLHNKEGQLVCFVEFSNAQCSTFAMNALQGCGLDCADRGGLRIEFAKNKMGERKKNEKVKDEY